VLLGMVFTLIKEDLNAKCKVELKSKFDSPVIVSNINFEWKEYGVVCEIPMNETLTGKGLHDIEFIIPRLPLASVSTLTWIYQL